MSSCGTRQSSSAHDRQCLSAGFAQLQPTKIKINNLYKNSNKLLRTDNLVLKNFEPQPDLPISNGSGFALQLHIALALVSINNMQGYQSTMKEQQNYQSITKQSTINQSITVNQSITNNQSITKQTINQVSITLSAMRDSSMVRTMQSWVEEGPTFRRGTLISNPKNLYLFRSYCQCTIIRIRIQAFANSDTDKFQFLLLLTLMLMKKVNFGFKIWSVLTSWIRICIWDTDSYPTRIRKTAGKYLSPGLSSPSEQDRHGAQSLSAILNQKRSDFTPQLWYSTSNLKWKKHN